MFGNVDVGWEGHDGCEGGRGLAEVRIHYWMGTLCLEQ